MSGFNDKRKKIGIISLFYKTYNFGAQIQAYALTKSIKLLGYDCEMIQFSWSNVRTQIDYEKSDIDVRAFEDFYLEIPHSKKVFYADNISECNDMYSHFICGSDQVWGVEKSMPTYIFPIMALSFTRDEAIRISYAASFGGICVSDHRKQILSNLIERFDFISVREKSAIPLMSSMTKKYVYNTIDPVFLLDKEQWDLIAIKPSLKKYILVYNISGQEKIEKMAEKLSDERGLQIIRVGYHNSESVGPKDFIGLIKYAEYVLTDSFHGIAMSIIYNKQFLAFPSDYIGTGFSKTYRVTDLLDTLGLERRYVKDEIPEIGEPIEWKSVNKRIKTEQKQSIAFLKESIGCVRTQERKHVLPAEKCIGCGVCSLVCNNNCIRMENDTYGFAYPNVNYTNCKNCGKCAEKCPVLNYTCDKSEIEEAYSYRSPDSDVVMKSSSGGMFYELAKWVINQNGVVVAARYDESFVVRHNICEKIEDLESFCQSKYVQSSVGEVFTTVQTFLENDRKALFVGTPCQVVALKKYLSINYEHLYTVDLICGGVTAPSLLSKYVNEINKDDKVNKISMRDKSRGYKEPNGGGLLFSMRVTYENNKEMTIYKNDDYFLNIRFSFYRESCFSCRFKGTVRLSDLTIGDDLLTEDTGLGRTLVIVHSKKGKRLIDEVAQEGYMRVDLNSQRKRNRMIDESFTRPSQFYYLRELFSTSSIEKLFYENSLSNEFIIQERLIKNTWIEKTRDDLTIRMKTFQFLGLNIDDVPFVRNNVLIYGAGRMGKELFDCGDSRRICGFIDKAGIKTICRGLPVFLPYEDKLRQIIGDGDDYTLIVTPVWEYLSIKDNMLCKYSNLHIVSLSDIMNVISYAT